MQLIYITLLGYISSHSTIANSPYSIMAETSRTYLNLQQVKILFDSPSPITRDEPFLEYCSIHGGAMQKKLNSRVAQGGLRWSYCSRVMASDLLNFF